MLESTLKQYFGFDSLRQGQKEVIEHVLNNQSAAAIFPTGSGKSLCYQLPALLLPHLTLVISPLLALMKDQINFLHSKGIAAASIDSTQDRDEIHTIMEKVKAGDIKVLMISVERLKNERFRHFIGEIPISLLVVDEAHCISEWGHNFRPDYLKLPLYRKQLKIPQVLLLTATATPAVINDMREKFAIPEQNITVTGFYRANLDLNIIPCEEDQKPDQLRSLMLEQPELPTIVYVTLQHTTEVVSRLLQHSGISALPYHAGLKSEVREQIQNDFMNGKVNCIVATIAFGMGIDKSDIRRVIHFDLPKSIENYSQEIGRAGRDGLPSQCSLLANKFGLNVLENFVYGDTPDKPSIKYVIEQIYQQNHDWELILLRLSREANIKQLPLKTLLVYLELQHIIKTKYSYFAEYRFKLNQTEQQIINKFHGERAAFVQSIFDCSSRAKVWHNLDFIQLWQQHQADRARVITALDYFHQQGWIELESKQMTDVYQVLDKSVETQELVTRLSQLFQQKENNEINRTQDMLNFFASKSCLSHSLAGYFADNQAPVACGHCSVCRGNVAKLPEPQLDPIVLTDVEAWVIPFVEACKESNNQQALTHKTITRFLCGLTTPLISKVKGTKMAGFGQFEQYPFATVFTLVSQIVTDIEPAGLKS
ncbi:RecQ family ATP-dependent DNA helicase [Vibrio sp. SS-MA-C1-2]|uniref:RecQ family ATP-dependent DNA helicase n=1 Tax=Vibrio sp. SS-MA-C1-2 TaxID=2908646 RepID=UPI001F1DB26F|nr:RecQ family ATP-dependent DNA helicase [Vibrio sp. SS-MA-C1-2]UJF18602.1 RecQ family ATP-dependent DNA helicase [Vibrio sp. SS-MA-C1-2]